MGVRSRRVRARPARRASASTSPGGGFARGRAGLGLGFFLLVFARVWLLNGEWTALGAGAFFGASVAAGWSLHLIISGVEILPALIGPYVPKELRGLLVFVFALSLPFGVFDVLSSSLAILQWLGGYGIIGDGANGLAVLLGLVIAFLPERAIMWLLVLLHRVYRG